jgi:thiol-disulfide isomerase/thioredoxin
MARQLLKENKTFPFDFTLPNVDGKKVSLADFRGKVVIVDFWGTWCPPCRQEIPHFVELLKKYEGKGLRVVGLNYERVPKERIPQTISAFVKQHKIPYPCLIGDDATREKVEDFRAFPTTLFIDRQGIVRAKLEGLPDSPSQLEILATTLLEETTAKAADNP